MKHDRFAYVIFTLMLLIACDSYHPFSPFSGKSSLDPIVRVVPPPGWSETLACGADPSGRPFRALMYSPALWTGARENIDYLGYYCGILDENFRDEELQDIFMLIHNWSLELSLEVTAVKYFPGIGLRDGTECFLVESPRWDRFIQNGAQIRELTMDEPLTSCKDAGETMEYAVEQTADWLELTRGYFGNSSVSISLIEAYPHISVENILTFIDLLNAECAERGFQGIDSFTLDLNWQDSNTEWLDVVYLEQECGNRDLPFCMIYWPACDWGPDATDEDFYNGIMSQAATYQSWGGSPDMYCVQSWVYVPRRMVSEDDMYSFTWAFIQFYSQYVN